MIMQPGDTILVAHRRLFADDAPRLFLGKVDHYEDGLVLATGHSWIRSPTLGEFYRKSDQRSKIIALNSGMVMVYQLPRDLNLDDVVIETRDKHQSFLTDGKQFEMDITDHHTIGKP